VTLKSSGASYSSITKKALLIEQEQELTSHSHMANPQQEDIPGIHALEAMETDKPQAKKALARVPRTPRRAVPLLPGSPLSPSLPALKAPPASVVSGGHRH
jgi:hypothetical protein